MLIYLQNGKKFCIKRIIKEEIATKIQEFKVWIKKHRNKPLQDLEQVKIAFLLKCDILLTDRNFNMNKKNEI